MSRVESLLTETLRDPDRALPTWPDPVQRVRQARTAQRRRRLSAVIGVGALAMAAAVSVPMLRTDDGRNNPPSGLVEREPVAVIADRIHVPWDGGDYGEAVVVDRGHVWVLSLRRIGEGPLIVDILGGRVIGGGPQVAPAGTRKLLRAPEARPPAVWALTDRALKSLGSGRSVGPLGCVKLPNPCPGATWQDGAVVDGGLVLTSRMGDGSWRLSRLDPVTGGKQVSVDLPGRSGGRVTAADGAVWVRRGGIDETGGSWLLRFDATTLAKTGQVKLPGSLVDGALVAGGGTVWAATAVTSEVHTTTGGVIPVDADTLAVGETISETPLALQMAYADGNVWLRGAKLARVDAATRTMRGEPIDLIGPASGGLAIDGRYVWVAGTEIIRYDWRYQDLPPEPKPTLAGGVTV